MKLLVLGKKNTFECLRILEEARNVGVDASFSEISNLMFVNEENLSVWIGEENILVYNAVLFRGLGKSFHLAKSLAQFLFSKGKIVIDEKLANTNYIPDKTLTMVLCAIHGLPYARTIQIFNKQDITHVQGKLTFPIIAKNIVSSQGRGVFLIEDFQKLKEFFEQQDRIENFILQQQLRRHAEDYRVFVVGGKALGVMKKTAKTGEYRSNVSQGGKTEMVIDSEIQNLGVKAAQLTNTEIAGVDIMLDEADNPYILEINRAPQFQGFEKISGMNIAKEIVWHCTYRYQQNTK